MCEQIEAAERSLMSNAAMFWAAAAYNNGILPFKTAALGEAYTRDGQPAKVVSPGNPPGTVTDKQKARGALAELYPLPTWQVVPPSDVFRVFEQGGRTINPSFAEIGLPNSSGSIQKLEEPGRPDLKQSNRGPGTGLRVAIAVLNLHKTRLNDPYMWFMGTNDQPGDYRHSGCAGCHVVYANSREPRESLTYAQYGRDGQTITADPTIANDHGALREPGKPEGESGHPLQHVFTRSIPTSQCMTCHMHQPNIFLNSFLGYTMWDYEADAPKMWPEKQKYPTAEERLNVLERNPEGAAPKGNWADLDFLRNVHDLNPQLKDTQFADYHGHGWNFRAVFKRDREGNLLDADGKIVSPDDPQKWRKDGEGAFVPPGVNPGKAVHLMDIHAEKGMQCADCHFEQDSHGSGLIMSEVASAIEIGCKDCHGTADAYPTLLTSGPAAPPEGPRPVAAAQPRRPAALRVDLRQHGPQAADPALDRRSQARMAGEPGQGQRRSVEPAFQRQGRARQADEQAGRRRRQVRLRARHRARRTGAQGRRDGVLHLPPLVDHQLRRLSLADRGQLEDRDASLRGGDDPQLRDLQSAGCAR